MKKLMAVTALAVGLVMMGAPVSADDASAPEPTTEQTEAAPESVAPDEEVETPDVEEEAPAPAAESKTVDPKTDPPKADKPKEFKAYEVDACWLMTNSDGVEGTYEWPQTRVYGHDCGAVPACGEVAEYQHDTYWIRDKDDKHYLKNLHVLNSPADDARLEPHDYYSTVVHGAECVTVAAPTITQPTCENPDYTINWVSEGEHWSGTIIEPPYSSDSNVVNVTANPDEGYEIQGQSYWELVIERLGDNDCQVVPPAVDTPATPTGEAVLPDTGMPVGLPGLLIALALAAAGVAVIVAENRRTAK